LLFKTRFYWQVLETSVSIANRSLVHEKHPGITERDAMWSLAMDGGAARRNWAIPVADSTGGGVEKEEELTKNRFVAVDRRRGAGGRTAGGAQGARPRCASSGGPPISERGEGGVGTVGRLCGTAGRHWTG
jgi:hypothetical protein